ncbi:LacI family DNA-binding transcriptional regulator [Agromyces larvae]|uniref:Substrate-binding domain-containing protein n=1 Tax=Agromyces larvae TaxID=2929802 RepID=A0ABY4BWC3_9MICO|nr:substrate-binding domain-containing protein [Agromyces larvae]UOE43049.1 substrate-binding domain-containing protein [Agromyces larvae]
MGVEHAARHRPTIGIVLQRSRHRRTEDPFYTQFVEGLDEGFAASGARVLLAIATTPEEESELYRRWSASGAVAGVVVVDLVEGDPRVELVHALGMPAVVLGEVEVPAGVAELKVDNHGEMREAVRHLAALGHRLIGRVAGPPELVHSRARTRGFDEALAEHGIAGVVEASDYSAEGGAAATRLLLAASPRPTAIVYDSAAMAVAGLEATLEAGVEVPGQVSLLAWDDSDQCRLADPPMSVMTRDTPGLGRAAAEALAGRLAGRPAVVRDALLARIVTRGTTGPAPT